MVSPASGTSVLTPPAMAGLGLSTLASSLAKADKPEGDQPKPNQPETSNASIDKALTDKADITNSLKTPTPEETAEMNKKLRVGIFAAVLAAVISVVGSRKLTALKDAGELLKFCQGLDTTFGGLNQWLVKHKPPISPLWDKIMTRTPSDVVMKNTLRDNTSGVVAWAKQHLPQAMAAEWQAHLSSVSTLEQLQNSLGYLKGKLTDKSTAALATPAQNKALKQLAGLKTRIEQGIMGRYFTPYHDTRTAIHKGNLQPVGQIALHALQSFRQLLSGEFAFQALGQKTSTGSLAFNGAVTLGFPIGAALLAEKSEKLKKFSEELWGNTMGNFLGWYWGTQWLNHGGWVTKALNRVSPGLATKPFLMGTVGGLVTEMIAMLAIGSAISKVGTTASHLVLGKPREWVEPKLPANYQPLIRREILSKTPVLKENTRLDALTEKDIEALMTNVHGLKASAARIGSIDPVINTVMTS
jgi:hypothetical protein